MSEFICNIIQRFVLDSKKRRQASSKISASRQVKPSPRPLTRPSANPKAIPSPRSSIRTSDKPSGNPGKHFTCICDKTFHTFGALQQHMKVREDQNNLAQMALSSPRA